MSLIGLSPVCLTCRDLLNVLYSLFRVILFYVNVWKFCILCSTLALYETFCIIKKKYF
jgi:hypothetical protein